MADATIGLLRAGLRLLHTPTLGCAFERQARDAAAGN